MAGCWPSSLLRVYGPRRNSQKQEQGQYLTLLTEQAWSIKDLLLDMLFGQIFIAGRDG